MLASLVVTCKMADVNPVDYIGRHAVRLLPPPPPPPRKKNPPGAPPPPPKPPRQKNKKGGSIARPDALVLQISRQASPHRGNAVALTLITDPRIWHPPARPDRSPPKDCKDADGWSDKSPARLLRHLPGRGNMPRRGAGVRRRFP